MGLLVKQVNLIRTNPEVSGRSGTLILAHGAGAPADSPFMDLLCDSLAVQGIGTQRFEFPYMQKRRDDGRKRPPDRQPVLLEHFRQVIHQVAETTEGAVYVGGKSMGGRMASLLAADDSLAGKIQGCFCFGYPFHAPGKPDRLRTEHFGSFHCPVLILQGTRDPFGKKEEFEGKGLEQGRKPALHWLEGGNHDFKPLARQTETQESLIAEAAKAVSRFLNAGD